MPFIDMGEEFTKSEEAQVAQEGNYDLVCGEQKYEEVKDEAGNIVKKNIIVQINFEGDAKLQGFRHWLALPNPEQDLKRDAERGVEPGSTSEFKCVMVERFLVAFKIPYQKTGKNVGFNSDDIPGARARLFVDKRPFERADGSQDEGNSMRLPKVKATSKKAA